MSNFATGVSREPAKTRQRAPDSGKGARPLSARDGGDLSVATPTRRSTAKTNPIYRRYTQGSAPSPRNRVHHAALITGSDAENSYDHSDGELFQSHPQ